MKYLSLKNIIVLITAIIFGVGYAVYADIIPEPAPQKLYTYGSVSGQGKSYIQVGEDTEWYGPNKLPDPSIVDITARYENTPGSYANSNVLCSDCPEGSCIEEVDDVFEIKIHPFK